jgi:hypothetical protein
MPDKFIVRNDNGSQFEADIVQKYLKEKGVTQEFTKPATPQQNARERLVILNHIILLWKVLFVEEWSLMIWMMSEKKWQGSKSFIILKEFMVE